MSTESNDLSAVFAALRFAADRHRRQRRKDSEGTPYVNHLITVLDLLWRVGGVRDPVTLAAAVLHDTIEDTDTNHAELVREFGTAIANLVEEVTDDKSLPKQRRKELQIEQAADSSPRARLIKLADKSANVADIGIGPPLTWSPERKREYLDWARQVIDRIRGGNPELEAHFDRACVEACRRLEEEGAAG